MVSIVGFMYSPFFSVYAATKAALNVFIESVNVENHDFKIINITRGGNLDVFERDDFDRVVNQL